MGLAKEPKSNLTIKGVERIDYFDDRYYKVLLIDKKGKMFYEYYDSVTEILNALPKPGLTKWRGDVGNDRADQISIEAFKLGSVIHDGAEVIAKGGAVVYNPINKPIYNQQAIDKLKKKYKNNLIIIRYPKEFFQLNKILEWHKILQPQKIECELTVFSTVYKYAGTLDLLFYLPKTDEYMISGSTPLLLHKGWYVADYKTGKGVDKSYKMQVASYINAVLEARQDLRKEFRGGLIIHTNAELVKSGIEGLKTHYIDMIEQQLYFKQFLAVQAVFKIDKPTPKPKELSIPTVLSLN